MSTVDRLIKEARRNEKIARNLFDIEVEIMNVSHSSDFLHRLLGLVKEKFELDYTWLVVTDVAQNNQLLNSFSPPEEGYPLIQKIRLTDFLQATQSVRDPLLVNREMKRFRLLIPKQIKDELGSVAVLPLIVESKIVGALCLGADESGRYDPKKDSFFLKQLAVKASISLDTVLAREKISFLATRDPLTLLRNRREMEETLEQELSRHHRHQQNLAVMFIDCDDFKLVNDTYGHDCGDAYLVHVAQQLNELTRKSDLAFRFAGDEFVVLLPNQSQQGAEVIAARIREHLLESPLHYQDQSIPVVVSYGVVSTDQSASRAMTVKGILKSADEKLYIMKKNKNKSKTRPA